MTLTELPGVELVSVAKGRYVREKTGENLKIPGKF